MSYSIRPRPEVEGLQSAVHGGPNRRELGILGFESRKVLDFSVNTNPLGPSPVALAALSSVEVGTYPDPDATELCQALARQLSVPVESVIAGNGSVELLWLLALAYLRAGDRVLIVGPTFGEYEVAARLMGAEVRIYRAESDADFQPDIAEVCRQIRTTAPRLVFLCNPNNPTGVYLPQSAVEEILEAIEDGLLVLDEAYIGFVEGGWNSIPLALGRNVVVLRSMTKDYALAGLRLGYVVAHPEVTRILRRVRPPWNVNAAAQVAGLASLSDGMHLARGRAAVAAALVFLRAGLHRLGFRVLPTAANFFLVEVGDATALYAHLLARSIRVRDCTSFGLPAYVRIAARPLAECEELLAAIAALKWPGCHGQESQGGHR